MALPLESRMTSNSISFQPAMHFSTRICVDAGQAHDAGGRDLAQLLLIV